MSQNEEAWAAVDAQLVVAKIGMSIASGQLDANLDAVSQLVRERREILRAQRAMVVKAETRVGDHVVVCGNISPQSLSGATGVVMEVDKFVRVRLFVTAGKYRAGSVVGVPPSCIRRLETDTAPCKKYVIAGDRFEFNAWCRDNEMRPGSDAVMMEEPEMFRGLELAADQLVITDMADRHLNYRILVETANIRIRKAGG